MGKEFFGVGPGIFPRRSTYTCRVGIYIHVDDIASTYATTCTNITDLLVMKSIYGRMFHGFHIYHLYKSV